MAIVVVLDSGSTSVLMAVDILLEQARSENCVSVQRVCSDLRRQYPCAVPTLAHYVFIYDCLHEALCTNFAWFGADLKLTYRLMSRQTSADGQTYFAEQFDLLCQQTGDQLDQSSTLSSSGAGRFVTLDSYRYRDCFILTNLSSQSIPERAAERLWRMVFSSRARCIVTFATTDDNNLNPTTKGDCRCYGCYELEVISGEESKGAVRWKTFRVRKEASSDRHSALIVRHFVFTGWQRNDTVPDCRRDEFIRLIRFAQFMVSPTSIQFLSNYCWNLSQFLNNI